MSAFIVSQNTLNNSVVLAARVMEIELSKDNQDLLDVILNRLYKINDESVAFRYDERIEEMKLSFSDFNNNANIEQLAKSFRCWNYQSCEKETMEYLSISMLINNWLDKNYPGIKDTASYDNAKWDY